MKPLPDLPDLKIVPTDILHPHEEIDESRASGLVEGIRADGILKNPPVVLPVSERRQRYVVLDGANRTLAFRLMEIPHLLVQVVHAGDNTVEVESWNHAVLEMDSRDLVRSIHQVNRIRVEASSFEQAIIELKMRNALAVLSTPEGEVFELNGDARSLPDQVAVLRELVQAYLDRSRIERVSAESASDISGFREFAGLVVFPRFSVQEVIDLAATGQLFPSGLTRFMISPRALRVNFPLEILEADQSLEVKQEYLNEWQRERLEDRRIRYYAEATFLYDE